MSANVEQKGKVAAFASRAVAAWHRLGTVFGKDDVMTTEDMLSVSHTGGWNVRLSPLADNLMPGFVETPDTFLVIRDNPFTPGQTDVLATVGKRYTPVQNEEVAAFGTAIAEVAGWRWETMGALDHGRRFFGSLACDDDIVLDPSGVADTINRYLLVASSHDGTMQVTATRTSVRVVCSNTLGMALRDNSGIFRARHTSNVKGRVEDARAALGMAVKYDEAFEAEVKAMFERQITNDEFHAIVESIYVKPEADVKGAEKKWANKIDLVEAIYKGQADGPDTGSMITGTAWGALNALTERIDYYRTPRKDNPQGVLLGAAGFDANASREKQIIWDTVSAFVKA